MIGADWIRELVWRARVSAVRRRLHPDPVVAALPLPKVLVEFEAGAEPIGWYWFGHHDLAAIGRLRSESFADWGDIGDRAGPARHVWWRRTALCAGCEADYREVQEREDPLRCWGPSGVHDFGDPSAGYWYYDPCGANDAGAVAVTAMMREGYG